MNPTLEALIQSGDRDAINAYLSQQDISGDSRGVDVNGMPSNSLTALVRGQPQPIVQPQQNHNALSGLIRPQPTQAPQAAMQPLNTIVNNQTGNYVTPAGGESTSPVQFQSGNQQAQVQGTPIEVFGKKGMLQADGSIIGQNPDGSIWKAMDSDVYAQKQAMIDKNLQRQHLMAQTAAVSDIKPKYEASNNSFIIPPDAQHPNGQVIPAGGAGGGQPQQSSMTGNDFLQTLAKPQADQVKALAEGRMAFPAGFALKSPYWQDMISKVSQYDPNFDAVNYQARQQTRNDFTKGASANNVTALNTAIQHLGKLSDAYDQLGNGSIPAVNAASNWLGNTLGNSDVQKNYAAVATDSTAVAHELAKVFRQSGMSEGEIKDWEGKISTSASPAQAKQVIQSAMDLMQGRLESLGARYNQGMGTTKQPYELLTPEAKQTWDRLNNGGQSQQAQASPSAPMANMPPPQSAAGRTVRDTTSGIRYKSDGNNWVRI